MDHQPVEQQKGAHHPRLKRMLPGISTWVGIAIAIVILITFFDIRGLLIPRDVRTAVLTILRGDDMSFYVERSVEGCVTVEINNYSFLLGKRYGTLSGNVTMYYGFNLKNISLSESGDTIYITLPNPTSLTTWADPTTFKYVLQRSGFNIIKDMLQDKHMEQNLASLLYQNAETSFQQQSLLPSREDLVAGMNTDAVRFFSGLSKKVQFK